MVGRSLLIAGTGSFISQTRETRPDGIRRSRLDATGPEHGITLILCSALLYTALLTDSNGTLPGSEVMFGSDQEDTQMIHIQRINHENPEAIHIQGMNNNHYLNAATKINRKYQSAYWIIELLG